MNEKRNLFLGILLGILIGGAMVSFCLLFIMNGQGKEQAQRQQENRVQRAELIAAVRASNQSVWLGRILDKVEQEINSQPVRGLSDETIARIAALSYSFKPYVALGGDYLSEEKYSPERGQLLLALSLMEIDSGSFSKIKSAVSFAGADLSGANLRLADLSGVDLTKANLSNADLRGVDLSGADLSHAVLSNANLNNADLRKAKFVRVNLAWAEMNEAFLQQADFSSADMVSVKLRKADMTKADLKYADLNGAFLNGAMLSNANLDGVGFRRADLTGADLSRGNLYFADLVEANLSKANMSGVNLVIASVDDENWFEKLDEWQVEGAKEIKERYKLGHDNSRRAKYRFAKK